MRYLVTAVQRAVPEVGSTTAELLPHLYRTPLKSILVTFINELHTISQPLIVILDDFHLITSAELHEAVYFLIQHLPLNIHLIIASRTEMPFPLGRLRAKQQISELTAADLQLNRPETKTFVNQVAQLDLPDKHIATLEKQSEGWLAGLQLVTLALRNAPNQLEGGQTLSHTQHVFEYLAEEVLHQQSAATQSFLKHTAVLERFSVDLADHILGRSDGATQLAQIQQENLFLIALDEQGEWYRYHHLFTDFLRSRLDKTAVQPIYQQAAVWHQQQGLSEEAIAYALLAESHHFAAELIASLTPTMLNQGQIMTVLAWMEQLPAACLHDNFELAVFRGYIASLQGDLAAAQKFCAIATKLLPPQATDIQQGYLLALQAAVATDEGKTNHALEYAQEALVYLTELDAFFYTMTLLVLGSLQQTLGEYEAAVQTQRRVLALSRQQKNRVTEIGAVGLLSYLLYRRGQRRAAAQLCQEVVDGYQNNPPPPTAGLAYVVLGFTYLATHQLTLAKPYLQQGVALCEQLGFNDFIAMGNSALVQLYLEEGELDKMWHLLESLRQKAVHPMARVAVDALEARVHLELGQMAAVKRWVQNYPVHPQGPFNPAHLSSYDIHVRWLLNQNELETAAQLLQTCETFAKEKGVFSNLVRIYLLQAQLAHQRHETAPAAALVEQALALAAPETLVAPFLQIPTAVKQLCGRYRQQYSHFVEQIIPAEEPTAAEVLLQAAVEPLSERELEILQLIAQGLSNRDIANQLVITIGTAKWHVHNILSKLAVKRRTQAVAKARELNWL